MQDARCKRPGANLHDVVTEADEGRPVGVAGVVLAAPAVATPGEAAVARSLVDAGGEEEAGVGEDLGWIQPRAGLVTSAAGLCQVKSVQPSVLSQTAWHSWAEVRGADQGCPCSLDQGSGVRCEPQVTQGLRHYS